MNLFLLSLNPQENAEMHCDQHVVKMILEGTQIICTVLHIDSALETYMPRSLTKEETYRVRSMAASRSGWYKPTHVNHPLVIWARSSLENFQFVKDYVHALHQEYRWRYKKESHRSGKLCETLPSPTHIPSNHSTMEFVLCMPDECKVGSEPVESYRSFYKVKKSFAKYKHRPIPSWLL